MPHFTIAQQHIVIDVFLACMTMYVRRVRNKQEQLRELFNDQIPRLIDRLEKLTTALEAPPKIEGS